MAGDVAGAGNDPLRALEALPGVILATPGTGGPVAKPAIRGSSPVDNEYQADFLPVGYVFHNDGLSTFNPLLIQSFSLYSSSWSPQYKDATGGVIVTELRDPSFEQSGWFLDAGAIRSSLLYEGQISPQAAFYFSLRQSFIHLYIDQFIEDEEFDFSTPPRNNDFQSKLVWDINEQNQLRLIATGFVNRLPTMAASRLSTVAGITGLPQNACAPGHHNTANDTSGAVSKAANAPVLFSRVQRKPSTATANKPDNTMPTMVVI